MKRSLRLLLLFMSLFPCAVVQAQVDDEFVSENTKKDIEPYVCRRNFFGLASGINANSGLIGVNVELGVARHVSVAAGGGLGLWGKKGSLEVKYYLKDCYRSWAVGLAVTRSSGLNGVLIDEAPVDSTQHLITINLLPQTNIALQFYKYWRLGRKSNRMYIHFGWSFATTTEKYRVVDSVSLYPDDLDSATRLLAPGGLSFGFGFNFGI